MLRVLDVHTYYGDSHVLQGVSLHVEKGAVAAVLGRNGVGKTTLCRSIVGFTPARAGRVIFNDVETTHISPDKICGMGLSLVPQGRRVFPSLTVKEHLAIAERRCRESSVLRTHSNSGTQTPAPGWDIRRVFDLFPRLAERRDHRGNELSGGEQQMLAIARALVANPVLVVMDEPTEGLAKALIADVANVIRRLKDEGTAVLLAEQNAAFAVKHADRVHVMSQGRIVHASAPAALWENEEIKTQFLGVPSTPTLHRER
jgi:branched-chain amino acid transport system ATP-binding protein